MKKRRKKRAKRESTESFVDQDTTDPGNEIQAAPVKGQHTSRFRFFSPKTAFLAIVCLLLLAFLAPMIVAKSSIFSYIVDRATARFDGQITVESASLGWFSPVRLNEIVVKDSGDEVMATVSSIVTDRSLFAITTNPTQIGRVTVTRPNINVVLGDGTSNWENATKNYQGSEPPQSAPSSKVALDVEVVSGRLHVLDAESQQVCESEDINVKARYDSHGAVDITINGTLAQNELAGQLAGHLNWHPNDDSLGSGSLKCSLNSTPVHLVRPFLHRFLPSIYDASGVVNGDFGLKWIDTDSKPNVTLTCSLGVKRLDVAADALGDDQLQLESATLAIDLAASDGKLEVREFAASTPIGHIVVSGESRLESFESIDVTQMLLDSVEFGNTSVSGKVDLAKIAEVLPDTLRIRGDTTITSGEVVWDTSTEVTERGPKLNGTLKTSNIAANQHGRVIRWKQPIELSFGLLQSNAGIVIERLVGHSDFLSFDFMGQPDDGQATARIDLAQLQSDLQQFVDFGRQDIAGVVDLRASWKKDYANRLTADSRVTVNHLVWHRPNQSAWNEPRLEVEAKIDAQLGALTIRELSFAQVDVTAGNEKFVIQITQPIKLQSEQQYPIRLHLRGHLENWQKRSTPFVDSSFLQVFGYLDGKADMVISPSEIRITSSKTTVQDLLMRIHGREYAEKRATIDVTGRVDTNSFAMVIPNAAVASTSVSASATNVRLNFADGFSADGAISFRGDLRRISRLAGLEQRGMRASGALTGRIIATHKAPMTAIKFSADTKDAEWQNYVQQRTRRNSRNAGNQWNRVWGEPHVRVAADASFDALSGEIQIREANVDTRTAVVTASGTLSRLDKDIFADLKGTTEYDWDVLSKQLRRYLGSEIYIAGRQQKPFTLQGPLLVETASELTRPVSKDRPAIKAPLVSNGLRATAGVGWTNAHAYGLDIQQSDFQASLKRQRIHFSSVALPVAQGRISASPMIDLHRGSPILLHKEGRVIEKVRLSPEICAKWLKYVAPMLADVAEANGHFSVDLKRANVPLDRPRAASVVGALHIEQAYVGPGSLSKQFLNVAQQIKSLIRSGSGSIVKAERLRISMPPQEVPFEMVNGRIGHRGLVMQFGDVAVRTEGWVSLDERLQMIAAVPIQRSWVDNDRILRSLAGQTLDIPIRGTLRNPRLDRRAVQQLTRKAVSGATEDLIKDELGKQLQKLFK